MSLWTTVAAIGGPVGALAAGWLAARATKTAALITGEAHTRVAAVTTGPEERRVDLAVLQATVERVTEENREQRTRLARLEALLRAFVTTSDRWAAQLRRAGMEPVAAEPQVDEYYRTGV
ncbi:hypothetical protein [Streptomyces sp. NPDC049881]|uniref:hypothetical protein n=1 Tax=unclassified Streptomyces TaxID=2593676 RepID=UPI00342192CF